MKESLVRATRELKPLSVSDMVPVQNQTGKDMLRWIRIDSIVETFENH